MVDMCNLNHLSHIIQTATMQKPDESDLSNSSSVESEQKKLMKEGVPNRVVDFKTVQALVGGHLTKYKASVTSTKYLDERITFGAGCNITIVCMTCNTNESRYTAKLRYLN